MRNNLYDVLKDLVERCDGPEGVRSDGSNIETAQAHAALEAIASGLDEVTPALLDLCHAVMGDDEPDAPDIVEFAHQAVRYAGVMKDALEKIAMFGDCGYCCDPSEERTEHAPWCPVSIAKRALNND